jgi:hypothetical protein
MSEPEVRIRNSGSKHRSRVNAKDTASGRILSHSFPLQLSRFNIYLSGFWRRKQYSHSLRLVSQTIVSRLDFSKCNKSLKNRMEACHYVFLIAEIRSHIQELLFYLGGCEGDLSDLKYLTCCIRSAYTLSLYVNSGHVYKRKNGFLSKRCKGDKNLFQTRNAALSLFLFNFQRGDFIQNLLSHLLVIQSVHKYHLWGVVYEES